MKTLHSTLIAGLAVLSLGAAAGSALAQTQDASSTQPNAHRAHRLQGQAPSPEQRAQFAAKRAEFAARRAAKLHDALRITPQQESAWTAFVAAMQPPARNQASDRAAWASLSAPERAAKLLDLQKQRLAQSERRLDALNTFYSVLAPDQKKTFDTQAARLQARWNHRGGMHGTRGALQKRPAPTAQG